MNKAISKILNILTTVLVCVLMVSLVCLVVIYLFGFSRTPRHELDANTIRQVRESDNKLDLSDYLDYSIVVPCVSAVCSSKGVDYCVVGGNENQKFLYNQVDDIIYALFNENANVTIVSEQDGRDIWKSRLLGDGVFFEWLSYVRKSAIFYNTFPDMLSQNITNEAIKCMVIYPVGDKFEAMAKIGNDRYALYRPIENSSVTLDLKKLEMNYPITFKFAAADNTVEDSFDTKVRVLPECLIIDEITMNNLDLENSLNLDNQNLYLNVFKINTVKASTYIDDAKNIVYVDEETSLVMGEKGIFYSSDTKNGIHISSIIGNSEEYEFKDYLCICNKLLVDLEIDIGNENVYISDIDYSNDYLTITYGFKHQCIPLLFKGEANPLKFVFKDNVLVSASIVNYNISEREDTSTIIQYLSIASYLTSGGEGNADFRLFYDSEYGIDKIFWFVQQEEYEVPGEKP